MDLTRILVLAVMLLVMIASYAEADFLYNRITSKRGRGMKCKPGRTVIKMGGNANWGTKEELVKDEKIACNDRNEDRNSDESNEDENGLAIEDKKKYYDNIEKIREAESNEVEENSIEPRKENKLNNIPYIDSEENQKYTETKRSHTNFHGDDSDCIICVCSVDGKDEYCSKRPARNVNECLKITENQQLASKPERAYAHERTLSHMIRKDLIWHKDEIPYPAKAKCVRGRSYYSNSIHANDTDIDVGSEVDSLLGYSNLDVCFFCICGVDGFAVGCIHRDPWYCNYYRYLASGDVSRDMYTELLGCDAPSYFRTLSYRVRRTMDRGTIDLLEAGGDTLCCDHPNGHRRAIHSKVRTKLHTFRKQRLQKENLMKNYEVGKGLDDIKCIPFASEYTDCTRENLCSGCTRCSCLAGGTWSCEDVHVCNSLDSANNETLSSSDLETALTMLQNVLEKNNERPRSPFGDDYPLTIRNKRAVHIKNKNVTFYGTVDELNEDTLKNNSFTGTLQAKNVDFKVPKSSRRTGETSNKSSSDALHIQYNNPLQNHIDSKIDANFHVDEKLNKINHEKIKSSQKTVKDKELTKLVVNELHRGTEVIGDKNAPSISNITFKSENETLTAMTFIAGNLLNRLWNMEKEADEDSMETELLKQEKIMDLIELFKEPLTLKQEVILKTALEKLSKVMTLRNPQNVSICEEINEVKKSLVEEKNLIDPSTKASKSGDNKQFKVVKKMNDVLDQLDRFENIRKTLDSLKEVKSIRNQFTVKDLSGEAKPETEIHDKDVTANVFGDILLKITKLILPAKSAKKIRTKINTQNLLRNHPKVSDKIKSIFGIDIGNNSLTPKDKLILDYLSKMETNPGCMMGKSLYRSSPLQKIESDILLNLSEFFKMKSFSDFIKLMGEKRKPEISPNVRKSEHNDQFSANASQITSTIASVTNSRPLNKNVSDFEHIKSKLKEHLTALLEDLKEIQTKNVVKSDLQIAAALPCLYNLLESDGPTLNKIKTSASYKPVDEIEDDYISRRRSNYNKQIVDVIDDIRANLKDSSIIANNRRHLGEEDVSTSFKVWNRVMKNIYKLNFRRKNNEQPQEDLEKIIEKAESLNSNVFKNIAILEAVHPADHLMLLKALQADAKKYITVLEKILQSKTPNVKLYKNGDIAEFVQNAEINIQLNGKVLNALNKLRRNRTVAQFASLNLYSSTNKPFIQRPFKIPELSNSNRNSFKLTRDQVATQLIKNRLRLFMKIKESSGSDALIYDTNYNLAKRILINIDNGNLNVAKQLVKVLLTRQEQNSGIDLLDKRLAGSLSNLGPAPEYLSYKEPAPQFDERSLNENPSLSYPDSLVRQLLNIKNLK